MGKPIDISDFGIPVLIEFMYFDDSTDWKHFKWRVRIGSQYFEYKTGIGHATDIAPGKWTKPTDRITLSNAVPGKRLHVPSARDILECLFSDSDCGSMTFEEFCSELGYDSDSMKAMQTYRDCQTNGTKLRMALSEHYERARKIVQEEESENV